MIEKNKQKAKVAFYTRISTDEDHQKYSLDAQKDRLKAFCVSQFGDEWEMVKLYRDTESGTHINRPGLEEMLYDAECQVFDTLLVFRVDRLSRKVRELAQMVEELDRYGVALKSITEPFDTSNAAGKMMLQMLGVFAEFEHATIVERTRTGMEKKAKSGRWVGGYVPYGYSLDPEKGLVINEEEALLVKKMFKMYVFGKEGCTTITNKLNEAGHKKRSGKRWDMRVVNRMIQSPLYAGKIKWREVIYEGTHDPIVSEALFNRAQEILQERQEELSGRLFHNGDERLLAGLIKCGKCRSHMVGVSTLKNDRNYPYYLCNKRWSTHDCDQDYVRADLLEAAIIKDVKAMFQDEQFMARIWEEANKRLSAEKPYVDKELKKVKAKMAKLRSTLNRYFNAFEAGKMRPEMCNEKVAALNAQLQELETEKESLEARRKQIELPAIDNEMLKNLVEHLDKVMADAPNPQKKYLMKRLIKKVVVHDRRTVEIWYCLPNRDSFYRCGHMAGFYESANPELSAYMWRSRRDQTAEPVIMFRIVHKILKDEPPTAHRDQAVEVALGPKDAFKIGNTGALVRRVCAEDVVSAVPPSRAKEKPPKVPREPRVKELMRTALEWQRLLDSGEVVSRADIARSEGITPGRVSQIMSLLRLAPEIQDHILNLPKTSSRPVITERSLRPMTQISNKNQQINIFDKLIN